ncbi:MAG TPA: MFS transporter [Streptosporangiaceae bacterium]|nr:MFS transporter [Streptosporangiaceae bacterium]
MASGLWAAERRALTLGLAATITFVAAEALAVVTVMPLVARDLRGLSLYGYVFSAFLLGTMVGIVAAGRAADKRGPATPYVTGIVVFAAGLTIAGLAPSMPVLIAGRTLQGLGAGAVPAVAYVAIGRSLPERLRARMMAVLSTAWVAPGLAGPALSAEVARYFGWRWVFLGLLPFIALTGPVAIPALVRLGREPAPAGEGQPHRLIDGIGVAVCAGLVLGGLTLAVGSATGQVAGRSAGAPLSLPSVLAGAALTVAGLAVGLAVLRRLLPAGTLSARYGLPATMLSRGLLTFCFFGADAFVTLAITILRHRSPVLAGVAVTGTTLSWTAGSWFQARMNSRWEARRLIRIGLVIILAGIGGLTAMLDSGVAVAVGIAAWTVAGLGMGMSYAPTTLLMLAEAPTGREGWASASLNLSDVLGGALGIGVGGAAISAAVRFGWSLSAGLAAAFAITAAAGAACFAVTRRLPVGIQRRPEQLLESAGPSGADGRDGGDLRVGHADQVGRS